MNKEKVLAMIEYLRVLSMLKASGVYCNEEITRMFTAVEKELNK